MSTTYKAALLRALAVIAGESESATIPLERIAAAFVRLYWDQTVRFGLRQAPQITKEPVVLRQIRATAERYNVRDYRDLPAAALGKISAGLVTTITHDVIPRFHNSKPPSMMELYQWSQGDVSLRLLPGAVRFLAERRSAIEVVANYFWARRLEKWNHLAPRVIEKVEGARPPRGNVRRYLALLLSVDPHCFYCERPLSNDSRAHVDHAISWNFLLEDYLWDLVPACASCNSSKSDRLPPEPFIEKLARRNFGRIISLAPPAQLHGADNLRKYYDAARSVEWPVWSTAQITRER